jgi:hypothetical protein
MTEENKQFSYKATSNSFHIEMVWFSASCLLES